MSVRKLTGRDGVRYLTRQVAAGDVPLEPGASLTAYYDRTGNPPGRWHGSGLAGLGEGTAHKLRPGAQVSEDAMLAVFGKGHDPITGESLGGWCFSRGGVRLFGGARGGSRVRVAAAVRSSCDVGSDAEAG